MKKQTRHAVWEMVGSWKNTVLYDILGKETRRITKQPAGLKSIWQYFHHTMAPFLCQAGAVCVLWE